MKWGSIFPLFVALVAVAAYANCFDKSFLFDDGNIILGDPGIARLLPFAFRTRFLVDLTFRLNYALGKFNVAEFHAVNLLIHILAALAMFGIVRRTLLLPVFGERFRYAAPWLATACASIWVAHPLNTESVTYICQRYESMMGLFVLLSLYCFVRSADSPRGRLWRALAVFSCAVGMGTKEGMIVAPFLILVYDYVFFAESFRELLARRWRLHVMLFATIAILYAFRLNFVGMIFQGVSTGVKAELVSPLSYLTTQFGVITHYLKLASLPRNLCLDYAWPVATQWREILVPGVFVGLLFAATLWAVAKRRPAGFLGAWFFITLAPTSSLVPIADMAAERRMYLPLVAVACAVVLGFDRLLRLSPALSERARRAAGGAAFGIVLILLIGSSIQRNRDYTTEEGMFRKIVAERPFNFRAHMSLTSCLISAGKLEESETMCRLFLERLRDVASDKSRKYRAIAASNVDYYLPAAHNQLGRVLLARNKTTEAMDEFNEAIRLRPDCEAYYNNVAIAYMLSGRTDDAIGACRVSIAIAPKYGKGHALLGGLLEGSGLYADALFAYRKALEIKPGQTDIECDLAWLLATCPDAAVRNGREAMRLATSVCEATEYRSARALEVLAAAHAECGLFDEAIRVSEQAIKFIDVAGGSAIGAGDDVAPPAGSRGDMKNNIPKMIELYRNKQPFRAGIVAHDAGGVDKAGKEMRE